MSPSSTRQDAASPNLATPNPISPTLDPAYASWVRDVARRFRAAQIKAAVRVNAELIRFYWSIGRDIVEKRAEAKWGDGFFKNFSRDLQHELPGVKGLTPKNLYYAKSFYLLYSQVVINSPQVVGKIHNHLIPSQKSASSESFPQVVGKWDASSPDWLFQIPWGHHRTIIDKYPNSPETALFYLLETLRNGWSRAVLSHHLDLRLHERQGQAVTNFSKTLPDLDSDLARELTKDPYAFDFTQLTEAPSIEEIEASLSAPLGDATLGDAASSRVAHDPSTRQDAASPSQSRPTSGDVASSRVSPASSTRQDVASPNPPGTRFFSQTAPVDRMRHNLPHWEQSGTTCFATFRLADSLPADKLEELRDTRARWIAAHPSPLSPSDAEEYRVRFEETAERWLDAGHGECLLRAPEARRAVEEAVRHFDGVRYALHAFVVMPNHVHVLFTPAQDVSLSKILHSWKSFSAKAVNGALGRAGTVWEKESWDRFIRNRRHFGRTLDYIRANPGALPIPVYVAPNILEWLEDVALGDAPLGDAASSRVALASSTRQDAASPNQSRPASGDVASSRVLPTPYPTTRQDAASPISSRQDVASSNDLNTMPIGAVP